jgi:hypothetical protein
MKTLAGKSRERLGLAILIALVAGLLLWQHPVQAARPDNHSSSSPLKEGHPPETAYFIVTYEGTEPAQEMVSELSKMQQEQRLSIVDPHFGENGILIEAALTEPQALLALAGVTGLTPIDMAPAQEVDEKPSAAGQDVTRLAGTGTISGTVTAADTGLPLHDLGIWVYYADTYDKAKPNWYQPDASGHFAITDLEPGGYKLSFNDWSDAYLDEWYDNEYSWYDASVVQVTDGATTKIEIELARPSRITGTVTVEESGLPFAGIDVSLRNSTYNIWYSTWTDENGQYDDGYLPEGTYTVCFSDPDQVYAPECYDDQLYSYSSGDPLDLAAGDVVSNVNASLARAATIAGTVTDATTSTPLPNVTVRAYAPTQRWHPLTDATTDISGTYRIPGLAPGPYILRFSDNDGKYLETYYDGQATFDAADPLTLTAGVTETVDVALNKGGYVIGRVVDMETNAGIDNVGVAINALDHERYFYTWTEANGSYTSPALPSGAYTVRFEPPRPYYDEIYDNLVSGYTSVWVTAPYTTGNIDAALRKGYVVTGTVTDDHSTPLSDVHVRLYVGSNSYYNWGATDYTGADGKYVVGPLSSGSYRIQFSPSTNSPYAQEWYSDVVTYSLSSPVAVPVDHPIDAQLSMGGYISGLITGSDGTPLNDVTVTVYGPGSSTSLASTGANEDGTYTTGALPPGNYQVRFSPWDRTYRGEWYDDQAAQQEGDLVPVTGGGTTAGIDADLAQLPPTQWPGHIVGGTLTGADTGEVVEEVTVCLYEDDPERMPCGRWAWDGTLDIPDLTPSTYHLYFDPPEPYSFMLYEDAYTPLEADPVVVTAGMTTTITPPVFQVGGSISGTVTAAGSGTPLRGTRVKADLQDSGIHAMGGGLGAWSIFKKRYVFADIDGNYHLVGLAPGQYRVAFYPPGSYVDATYGSGTTAQAVEPLAETLVEVTLGETTPDIDAALEEGGVITGVVTAVKDGQPLPNATVTVYDSDQTVVASTATNMDGVYTTPGLPAGTYKVFFTRHSAYLSEWNGDADSFGVAPSISVPAPGSVPDVNAALTQGGRLSGTVYDQETGWPLPFAKIGIYRSANTTLVATSWANNWGYYESAGLPAGSYTVAFSKDGYATRWYGETDQGDGTSVTLELGETLTGIGAYLPMQDNQIFLPLVLRNP